MIGASKRSWRGARANYAGQSRLLRVEPLEDRRLLSANRAAEAINQFAYDIYEHMQNEQGNLFYSPLSMATALTMAYAGAVGQTATEMADVLHVGTEPGIHSSYGELLSLLASQTNPDHGFEIDVANAMWPQLGMPLQSAFIDIVENQYDGYAQGIDYGNPSQAEDIINDWVEDQTHGKIKDLVSGLTPDTVMVLTNAVYFKGLWEHQFDPEFSRAGWFQLNEEEGVQTPMMWTQADVMCTTIDGFQVLDMPFQGGSASMVFIVPTEWNNELTTEVLEEIDDWFAGPRWISYADDILLPKFEITVSTSFNALLRGLGMPSAFRPDAADFSEIFGDSGIFIRDVFHKATLSLTEQGTEAGAASKVEFVLCFASGTPVMTPDGEKRIEDLRSGDYVLARDEHNLEGPVEPRMVERLLYGEAKIVELQVGGQVIRTTAPHPFFVRGQGWTPAGEIKVEDRLSTNHGDWIEVEKVLHTDKIEAVYNLRVAGHRTYFVGSTAWKFGVWVHNDYDSFTADRPFHFLIRDNTTSTITFMGRIDDPTQSENNVAPRASTVAPSNADFNADGAVDGRDFLAWQRGFGKDGATLADGDSNADGHVDAQDLATWQGSYGQTSPQPALILDFSEPDVLDDDVLFEELRAVEQAVVDRAFDHWVPPRQRVSDFGDIATRRTAGQVDPASTSPAHQM